MEQGNFLWISPLELHGSNIELYISRIGILLSIVNCQLYVMALLGQRGVATWPVGGGYMASHHSLYDSNLIIMPFLASHRFQ